MFYYWNFSEELMVVTPGEVLVTSSSGSHHPPLGGTQVERVKGKDYKVSYT
jgi:hypothetical protein